MNTTLQRPADIQAERALVTAVYADNDLMAHAVGLQASDFHHYETRAAWESAVKAVQAGRVVTLADLSLDLQDAAAVPLANFAREYAQRVREKAGARRAIDALGIVAKAAYAGDLIGAREALAAAAADLAGSGSSGLTPAGAIELPQHESRIQTMRPIDAPLRGGLRRQTLNIIMGRPGSGKTSVLAQMSFEIARRGARVAVYSLEETAGEWIARICSGVARVDANEIEKPGQARVRAERVREMLAGYHLMINDAPVSTLDIGADAERARLRAEPIDVIVVDHLRLLKDKADNENHRLGVASWGLKQIAKRFNLAVVSGAQLNRGVEQRTDRRPELSDLRDSGEIEENADAVIGLYRPKYYDDGAGDEIELLFRKNRKGETARAEMIFDAAHRWLMEIERRG